MTNSHIYIYTLQGLRYPREALQPLFTFILYKDYDTPGKHYNLCLHLYFTRTTIPQGSITTFVYIYTLQGLRYPREALQPLFTFILYKDYDTPGKHYNLCLHLYFTRTTIPQGSITTFVYIYTLQGLRYPREALQPLLISLEPFGQYNT